MNELELQLEIEHRAIEDLTNFRRSLGQDTTAGTTGYMLGYIRVAIENPIATIGTVRATLSGLNYALNKKL